MATVETRSYDVRPYSSVDEERVLALLRHALGEGGGFARTTEFFRWKHIENHFGPSQMLVADGETLLGLRAFMRWRFNTPHGAMRAVRAVDTATHPGYRRLGVFSRLTRDSLDRARAGGVHLIFNTPNSSSMPGYLKLGWTAVGRPRLLIRIINAPRMLVGMASRRRMRLTPDGVARFFRAEPTSVEEFLSHEERVAAILRCDDELCRDGIRTDRSVDFLRWRYASAPSPQYFAFWTGRRPVTGALIIRPNVRNRLREIMISEFLVGYGAAPESRALVDALARSVRADYMVASAAAGTEHWGLLRRSGFIPLPERFGSPLVAHPLTWPSGALDPRQLSSWRLSLGDLELF